MKGSRSVARDGPPFRAGCQGCSGLPGLLGWGNVGAGLDNWPSLQSVRVVSPIPEAVTSVVDHSHQTIVGLS